MQAIDKQQPEGLVSRLTAEWKERFLPRRFVLSVSGIICLCFLLTSTSWLAWEYHLLSFLPSYSSDLMTMVVGYALQAAGIGVFAVTGRRYEKKAEKLVPLALVLHLLCLVPAVLSRSLWGTLAAGFSMNLFCGYISGYYLLLLTCAVDGKNKGTALGIGYSVSIMLSWLLSQVGGRVYYSGYVWLICAALTVLLLILIPRIRKLPQGAETEEADSGLQGDAADPAPARRLIVAAAALVLLFSVISNIGFAFPSADMQLGIRIEFSRLFYAAGLMLAGFITDRNRKLGSLMALAALSIPYMVLALRAEPVSRTVFWAFSYFACGFYSIYRMVVFSDLAGKYDLLFLSGFGLMVGRIGDAAGEAACLALGSSPVVLVVLASLLFAGTVFLFHSVYRTLYAPEKERRLTGQERFYQFAVQHDLSSRERDMLRLLLEGKANSEIAQELSISENTVKFHIRNLLQKTGCKNRNDLLAAYIGQKDG